MKNLNLLFYLFSISVSSENQADYTAGVRGKGAKPFAEQKTPTQADCSAKQRALKKITKNIFKINNVKIF
jgi:hypothetical protein